MNGNKKKKEEQVEQAKLTNRLTAKDLQEAPASATIKFYYMGFDILYTVRGFSRNKLWDDVKDIVEILYKSGAQPIYGKNAKPEAKAEPESEEREHWCEKHDVEFQKWTSEDGKRSWYSHKIKGTDDWCNEPKKKKS